jgi:hypothetical protein
LIKSFVVAALLLSTQAPSPAPACPDVRTAADRHAAALQLAACLGDPDPKVRDSLAFEGLSTVMRGGSLEPQTLSALRAWLLGRLQDAGSSAMLRSFSALTLSEIARTDRIKAWMTEAERQQMVDDAASFLAGISDYRAFSNREGFLHAVAHGADFAMQLSLNPLTTKPQLDRLLASLATQVAPAAVAYWAGEPDRLARAVVMIAQRKMHSDAEWKAWFETVMDPKPLTAWNAAFTSETGLRKRHNTRAFLLSVYATAVTSEDAGLKQLLIPARDSLKLVP